MEEEGNRCFECGAEFKQGDEQCVVCNASLNQVRVMTSAEREKFTGMTIQQDGKAENGSSYDESGSRSKIYVRQVNFGGAGLLTKLIIGAGLVALVMLVALPLILVFLAAAGFGWLVFRRKS